MRVWVNIEIVCFEIPADLTLVWFRPDKNYQTLTLVWTAQLGQQWEQGISGWSWIISSLFHRNFTKYYYPRMLHVMFSRITEHNFFLYLIEIVTDTIKQLMFAAICFTTILEELQLWTLMTKLVSSCWWLATRHHLCDSWWFTSEHVLVLLGTEFSAQPLQICSQSSTHAQVDKISTGSTDPISYLWRWCKKCHQLLIIWQIKRSFNITTKCWENYSN